LLEPDARPEAWPQRGW